MNKTIAKVLAIAVLALPIAAGLQTTSAQASGWDVTGNYVINFNYLGTDHAHDVTLSQDTDGNVTGNGGSPAGSNTYLWTIDSGTVSEQDIHLVAHYTATPDALGTVFHIDGTIDEDGKISGTWSDNYQGGDRSGTFTTTSGSAEEVAVLVAEDFGVVNYEVSPTLGTLKGYSAGFGLYDGFSFADASSTVVKLYGAGDQLLQTNTLVNEVPGHQISSPFDVSGNFDYVEDGYWTNVRQAEYGQTVPAVKVVATVTLDDGTVLTATNTNLSGNPADIMPEVPPTPPTPTNKEQCKNGGWKTFTNPSYKNQGQCVSATNH